MSNNKQGVTLWPYDVANRQLESMTQISTDVRIIRWYANPINSIIFKYGLTKMRGEG